MTFLFAVASRRVTVQQVQRRQTQSFAGTRNRGIATTSRRNYASGQAKVVKCYNCLRGRAYGKTVYSAKEAKKFCIWFKEKLMLAEAQEADCDDISSAKTVLMENLSSYNSDVLSEESQDAGIQDTNSSTPNDLLVLSFVEQMTDHVASSDKENQTNKLVKEKESLSTTLIVFQPESKEKESKYIDKEIVLENQNKELENILYKLYRSTQSMHMLTKPEVFEQAFWLKHSNYNPDTSVKSHTPVRIEAPSELPKISLVNESLKKLKYQLASFDKVVKKRTTSDAITADEVTEVQIVFNQMEAAVDQCS
ncbi:hypothetical protein Tco_1459694, partial [Tanacetum coccineum]